MKDWDLDAELERILQEAKEEVYELNAYYPD
jgi:hypothetical protein